MGEFSNVLLVINKAHTVPQRALDSWPDLGTNIWNNLKLTPVSSHLKT